MRDCEKIQRLIEAYFLERRPDDFQSLRPHLDECDDCRQVYDRMFAAEAALQTDPDKLSASEKEMVFERATGGERKKIFLWAPIAALAMATALLIVFLVPPKPREDELKPRGEQSALGPVSTRLLCLTSTAARSLTVGDDIHTCKREDSLGFAFRNTTETAWHMRVMAGDRIVFPPDGGWAAVPPSPDDTPLDFSLPLGDESSELLVRTLLTEHPIEQIDNPTSDPRVTVTSWKVQVVENE